MIHLHIQHHLHQGQLFLKIENPYIGALIKIIALKKIEFKDLLRYTNKIFMGKLNNNEEKLHNAEKPCNEEQHS